MGWPKAARLDSVPRSIPPEPLGSQEEGLAGQQMVIGRRGCPADGRLSGQMAGWVGVRSSPICSCLCRGFSPLLRLN